MKLPKIIEYIAWTKVSLCIALLVVSVVVFSAPPPTIAAASDLQFALADIASRFQQEQGLSVRLSFGSSGNFQRQIQQGAPYQLFLSADEQYVLKLHQQGLTLDAGQQYALGRIMLYVPMTSSLKLDAELSGLREALDNGSLGKFAIPNPEHAPYGRAARQALQHAGLWQAIQPHLVIGESASQATRFASSGSVDGGLIPHALFNAAGIRERGKAVLISADWHRPLNQRMALLKGAGDTARAFYQYLQQDTALGILRRYGFSTRQGQ